jgi:hypothetical protein
MFSDCSMAAEATGKSRRAATRPIGHDVAVVPGYGAAVVDGTGLSRYGRAMLERVISGGQTGADQAGLAAAKRLGVPTGGFMPKG